jgi:hypothetical protein
MRYCVRLVRVVMFAILTCAIVVASRADDECGDKNSVAVANPCTLNAVGNCNTSTPFVNSNGNGSCLPGTSVKVVYVVGDQCINVPPLLPLVFTTCIDAVTLTPFGFTFAETKCTDYRKCLAFQDELLLWYCTDGPVLYTDYVRYKATVPCIPTTPSDG